MYRFDAPGREWSPRAGEPSHPVGTTCIQGSRDFGPAGRPDGEPALSGTGAGAAEARPALWQPHAGWYAAPSAVECLLGRRMRRLRTTRLARWAARLLAGVGWEIAPASELQEEYGLYAGNRPVIEIESDSVPAHLRDIIPLVEMWGIPDDIIRSDFADKASSAEKGAFQKAMTGRTSAVVAWLDTFPPGEMPDSAAHFMYMLEALDENGLWPDS